MKKAWSKYAHGLLRQTYVTWGSIQETHPDETEPAAALELDAALGDALQDVVADVVRRLEAVLVVHVLQHELIGQKFVS